MIHALIVAPYASSRTSLETMLAEIPDCAVIGAVSGSAELSEFLSADYLDLESGEEFDDGILSGTVDPIDLLVVDVPEDSSDVEAILAQVEAHSVGLVWIAEQPGIIGRLAQSSAPGWAVLRQDHDIEELGAALQAIPSGVVVIDRIFARTALALAVSSAQAESGVVGSSVVGSGSVEELLTPRERQVLQLMAEGLANKQIGGKLKISLHTVKFHVAAILAKLEASSRTEAVTVGARRGMISL